MFAWFKSFFAPTAADPVPYTGPKSRKYNLHEMDPGETRFFASGAVRSAASYLNRADPERFRFRCKADTNGTSVTRVL
jgi:hypothetical protein